MKKTILILAAILFSIGNVFPQVPENSIKRIARDWVVEQKELFGVDICSQNNAVMSVYDYKNKVDILDPYITVSPNDTLSFYKIQTLNVHGNMHFMFTKSGKWMIISMGGGLPEVMSQGAELCEKLKLDFYESLYVFKEILQFKEMYYEPSDGEDVVIE